MPANQDNDVQFMFDMAAITVAQATFVASIAAHHLFSDNQDDDTSPTVRRHGGSSIGRQPNLNRDTYSGHCRLMLDYFAPIPVYPPHIFRRRFRMQKDLFMRIVDQLGENDVYFTQRSDALGTFVRASTLLYYALFHLTDHMCAILQVKLDFHRSRNVLRQFGSWLMELLETRKTNTYASGSRPR